MSEHPDPTVRAWKKTQGKIRENERIDYNEQDVKEARQEKANAEKNIAQLKRTVVNLTRENHHLKLKQTADQERVEQMRRILSPIPNLQEAKSNQSLSINKTEQNSRLKYLANQRQARKNSLSIEQDRSR